MSHEVPTAMRGAVRTLGRGFLHLVFGLAGTIGLVFIVSTLAGMATLWMETGANPWSQVQDLGIVSALVTWPLIGLWFAGAELIVAFFTSGTLGRIGIIGITACLLALWVVALRRGDAFRHTVLNPRA